MAEMLQEFVDSGDHDLRVDRAAGVIRGVKLLGLRSRNGRQYLEPALRDSIALYEGAKVNVNHPQGHPLAPRDYRDRLGVIRRVRFRAGEGLFGDLQFNPKHPLSEQLIWDAQHASQNVGLSHNVLARTRRQDGHTAVEAITKVQSIDLVADPATTRGLFEQQDAAARSCGAAWDELTVDQLRLHRPDLLEELQSLIAAPLAEARREVERFRAREAARDRRHRIEALLQQQGLPLPGSHDASARQLISESFLESLMQAGEEATVVRLIEERARLVRSAQRWGEADRLGQRRPVSRDPCQVAAPTGDPARTAEEFALAVGPRRGAV